jgi:hypothetical protein
MPPAAQAPRGQLVTSAPAPYRILTSRPLKTGTGAGNVTEKVSNQKLGRVTQPDLGQLEENSK